MCKRNYPLQWLDLIMHFDDPTRKKTYDNGASHKGIEEFINQLEEQFKAIRSRIQGEVYKAKKSEKRARHLVKYYYNSLTYYMNLLYEKEQQHQNNSTAVKNINNLLIDRIGTLLNFIEEHYDIYLDEDQKVPKYRLNRMKVRMQDTLKKFRIREQELKCSHSRQVCTIILNAIERFTKTVKHHYTVTYKCLNYRLELLRKLETMEVWESDEKQGHFPLDTLLIFMNFNSKTYIDYLTSQISEKINGHECPLTCLMKFYKEFKKVHSDPSVSFNPQYQNLAEIIDKWFQNEIHYHQNVLPHNTTLSNSKNSSTEKPMVVKPKKVLCELSSDQIALFLRAADESRVLLASSMTEVFRSIVPHLSTQHKKDLSYEAVRIKSYSPEQSDKEAVVQILKKMIEKITDY